MLIHLYWLWNHTVPCTLNTQGSKVQLTKAFAQVCQLHPMARSHWAFLSWPMHSRLTLTSIRRCSWGLTEPSANNRNSWCSWGSISRCPKFSMLALTFFANHWRCFVRSVRRIFGDDQRLIAEYSPNNHWTFANIFNMRCIGESRRSICETSAIIRQ